MGHQQVVSIGRQLLIGLLNGLGLATTILLLGAILNYSKAPQYTVERLIYTLGTPEMGQKLLLVVLVLPILEELICRGYIYTKLASFLGCIPAMMVASGIYAVLHLDVSRLILLFLAGVWLNIVYIKAGKILPAIIAHVVWNGIMVSLALSG